MSSDLTTAGSGTGYVLPTCTAQTPDLLGNPSNAGGGTGGTSDFLLSIARKKQGNMYEKWKGEGNNRSTDHNKEKPVPPVPPPPAAPTAAPDGSLALPAKPAAKPGFLCELTFAATAGWQWRYRRSDEADAALATLNSPVPSDDLADGLPPGATEYVHADRFITYADLAALYRQKTKTESLRNQEMACDVAVLEVLNG